MYTQISQMSMGTHPNDNNHTKIWSMKMISAVVATSPSSSSAISGICDQ